MEEYIKYFKELLKKAGAKIIFENTKSIEKATTESFVAVLLVNEEITKGTRKGQYLNEQKKLIKQKEKFIREIKFQILISENNLGKIDNIFKKVLSEIAQNIKKENGDIANIEIGSVEYIDKKDTFLKSEITLQAEILVKEKVIQEIPYKEINIGGDGIWEQKN